MSTGEIGELRAAARTALESIAGRLDLAAPEDAHADEPLSEPPGVGQPVFVATFGERGIVRAVSGRHVEVEVRGKRMRVGMRDLRRLDAAKTARAEARSPSLPGSQASGLLSLGRELMVIGSTVDEALARAEKFLDDALLADERRLRVVHGHGTGRLREALRRHFREHPLVASVAPAPENEGGDGATIVELKE